MSKRTLHLRPQQRSRTLELRLEEMLIFLRGSKLLAELRLGARQVGRRHGHVAPLGLLIHQLLEDHHLHRAVADTRFHGLGETRCARARTGKMVNISRSRSRSVSTAPFTRTTVRPTGRNTRRIPMAAG